MQPGNEATCVVIKRGEGYHGKQGLDYLAGVSAETTGSKKLCMHMVTIPPGGRAKAHLHAQHESAIYVLSGQAGTWYGPGLREHVWLDAGDFFYIPANTPHLPYNPSEVDPCVGLVARTDANEQESVTLLTIEDPGIAQR
ncbi:MAG TPA: cupin domain-containing protein [Bryobacteraceae bacterium]|nr:cupin domain-containing protein [Bryobacteraceae bacterium]